MVRLKRVAALAAAFALCAPASAQKIWGLPPSGPLAGNEQIPATSGTGCAEQALPCKMVSVTPAQLASYLTPGFQPADADLSAIAALFTTPFGRSLLTLTDAPTARSVLGLTIGSNVEAWDADLDAIAAATGTNAIYYRAAPGVWQQVGFGPNLSFANGMLTIPGLPIVVSGDATGTGTAGNPALALTLATVNSSPGACGSSSALTVPVPTIGAKGLVTNCSAYALGSAASYPIGTSGAAIGLLNGSNTYAGTMTFTQPIVGSVTGSAAKLTIARAINGVSFDGSGNITIAAVDSVTPRLAVANNLSDLGSPSTARANIGAAASGANADITSITGSAAKWTSGRTVTATGDTAWVFTIDGSANVSVTTTLPNVSTTAGSYGGPLSIPTFTANAKGQVLASGAVALGTVPIGQGGTGATTPAGAVSAIGAQPASPILSAVAAQVLNADTCVYWTGGSSAATYGCTSYGRGLVGTASAVAAQSYLGLGSAALASTGTSGSTVGFLNGNNTYSGADTFSGSVGVGIAAPTPPNGRFQVENPAVSGGANRSGLLIGNQGTNYIDADSTIFRNSGNSTLVVINNGGLSATSGITSAANIGVGSAGSTGRATLVAGNSSLAGYVELRTPTNALLATVGNTAATAPVGLASSGTGWALTGGPVTDSSAFAATTLQATAASTVANLPTCNTAARGTHTVVTDVTSPTFLGALTGGGSVVAPAFCNGTAWIAG